MDQNTITKENNEGQWAALYSQWIQEHKPGVVQTAKRTYQVLRKPGNVVEFRDITGSGKASYESTSF